MERNIYRFKVCPLCCSPASGYRICGEGFNGMEIRFGCDCNLRLFVAQDGRLFAIFSLGGRDFELLLAEKGEEIPIAELEKRVLAGTAEMPKDYGEELCRRKRKKPSGRESEVEPRLTESFRVDIRTGKLQAAHQMPRAKRLTIP